MNTDDVHSRMTRALAQADPTVALHRLALKFRDEGQSQRDLMVLFGEFQWSIDADDPRNDAVVDCMDLIHGGPWAKGRDLFPTEYDPGDDV